MATVKMTLNGEPVELTDEGDMPLLWALRDRLSLTGTKFGCGIGYCGACTVLVDGAATRSCITAIADVAGADVVTIEGLSADDARRQDRARRGGVYDADAPTDIQAAWIAEQVPQCGYCQSGMIMAATALLRDIPNPSDADIDAAITNICRCGTYPRVRRAIKLAASGGAKAAMAETEKAALTARRAVTASSTDTQPSERMRNA